jgi:hypothetical protein
VDLKQIFAIIIDHPGLVRILQFEPSLEPARVAEAFTSALPRDLRYPGQQPRQVEEAHDATLPASWKADGKPSSTAE